MHGVERAIARIAGRQDNVISRDQLLEAGLGRGQIARRVAAGRMRRLHRSVYLIGPAPPTLMARGRAAVMACGPGAVLSHRSAAELFGLLPEPGGDVHVTVAGRNPGVEPGIRLHRSGALAEHNVTKVRSIPVTSMARTIADLASTESPGEVEHAFQEPLTNVHLHGYLVDAYWPEQRLVLEFDGWQAHGHRNAFDGDRRRDQVMLAHGLRAMRVTDRHLVREAVALVARIAQALRAT